MYGEIRKATRLSIQPDISISVQMNDSQVAHIRALSSQLSVTGNYSWHFKGQLFPTPNPVSLYKSLTVVTHVSFSSIYDRDKNFHLQIRIQLSFIKCVCLILGQAPYILTYLIFSTSPWGRHHYSHFTQEESRGIMFYIPWACGFCESLAYFTHCYILSI